MDDCHQKIKDAFPAARDLFKASYPDCDLHVDYTYRSPEVQLELFAKGREKREDGLWYTIDASNVVTHDDGTVKKSHHNVYPSQAADIYIMRNGHILWATTLEEQNLYQALGRIWEGKGLISGATWKYNWKDWPHIQVSPTIV